MVVIINFVPGKIIAIPREIHCAKLSKFITYSYNWKPNLVEHWLVPFFNPSVRNWTITHQVNYLSLALSNDRRKLHHNTICIGNAILNGKKPKWARDIMTVYSTYRNVRLYFLLSSLATGSSNVQFTRNGCPSISCPRKTCPSLHLTRSCSGPLKNSPIGTFWMVDDSEIVTGLDERCLGVNDTEKKWDEWVRRIASHNKILYKKI